MHSLTEQYEGNLQTDEDAGEHYRDAVIAHVLADAEERFWNIRYMSTEELVSRFYDAFEEAKAAVQRMAEGGRL